jgi:hypothetical protein
LDRRPALRRMFVLIWVVAGRMEDGDADAAVGVYYRVFVSYRICRSLYISWRLPGTYR